MVESRYMGFNIDPSRLSTFSKKVLSSLCLKGIVICNIDEPVRAMEIDLISQEIGLSFCWLSQNQFMIVTNEMKKDLLISI
jgi:hypothetical protein